MVRKGEQVKVIRDYDESYYLVAAISTGRIGFIPKDYTVDLKEIRNRVKQQQQQQSPCSISENLGRSLQAFNSSNCVTKLTKL